jgi:hypothetical protein
VDREIEKEQVCCWAVKRHWDKTEGLRARAVMDGEMGKCMDEGKAALRQDASGPCCRVSLDKRFMA